MLNMLIAIMGDTFAHVMENRELNRIKTKLKITSELASNFKDAFRGASRDERVFLFVVTPDETETDESGTWEGTVKEMSKLTERCIS